MEEVGVPFPAVNYGGYPSFFPFYHGNPKFRPPGWSRKGGLQLPELPDCIEVYKRSQLKAILSQVSPGLAPRLRRPNTREFGVQVNPRADASVQCSLGPKTLCSREDSPPRGAVSPRDTSAPVRFSRPLAIYSPVFDRRLFSRQTAASGGEREEEGEGEEEEVEKKVTTELEQKRRLLKNASQSRHLRRLNFQFLEQKYGFYHCNKCNIRWESAYVWCITGSCKVYFKQHCRKCQAGLNPYRVESIQCQTCGQTRCTCEQKQRHIDLRRPHRQDLCGRCKGKRLSCDTTYSFKYIV